MSQIFEDTTKPMSSVPLYVLTALRQWCLHFAVLPWYCQGGHWALGSRYLHHIFMHLEQCLKGVSNYMVTSYERTASPSKEIMEIGSTCVKDYGEMLAKDAPVMLMIPSLLNRAYIFDLMPDLSTVSYLLSQNIRPIMVDWGVPITEEYGFGFESYHQRLEKILDEVKSTYQGKITVMGYCMGGLLALTLAVNRQKDLEKLILLATPWDFHQGELYPILKEWNRGQERFATDEPLSPQVMQTLFSDIDPMRVQEKFMRFSQMEEGSDAFEHFVAVEHWLHDMLPLTQGLAQECLQDLFMENKTQEGGWLVNPTDCQLPTISVIPTRDYIVPQASSEALAALLPNHQTHYCPSGHIGMLVGRSVKTHLWPMII